ncbi:hypothetical protein RchiOBHm_Chr2g0141721 [Rosa chinensis]|uniref:Uncharacterized protein n=1 Tax=Rosa chinensis TaxID=74649 RepID=A0A2P6RXP2_ROSCH|nr:hypothetical protein RchiOBHm_Chr2g0141721 [Rosa chinensis]
MKDMQMNMELRKEGLNLIVFSSVEINAIKLNQRDGKQCLMCKLLKHHINLRMSMDLSTVTKGLDARTKIVLQL